MLCIHREGKYIYSYKKTKYIRVDISTGVFTNNLGEEVNHARVDRYFPVSYFKDVNIIEKYNDNFLKFIVYLSGQFRRRDSEYASYYGWSSLIQETEVDSLGNSVVRALKYAYLFQECEILYNYFLKH